MWTGILRSALLLLVVVACGCGDPPTSPAGPSPTPSVRPPFEPPIRGEYTLTFTASPSCSLPPEARQRSYTATVAEPSPGSVTVVLSDADFGWGTAPREPRFEGTRDGDRLRFTIGVGERVDGTKELSYYGTASATLADKNMAGTFNGNIWLNVAGNLYDWIADCTATDHKIDFARR
jgi:hypothetical protein